ncbi:lipopolysaccharide-assembly, LptC-related protein [Methylobacterium iners]|uniref:Lipopolysaccharide-assembly, LptC-related protein n=1 Tax=Methylobacterium iners TaxID=418707 RepID=A0ABQ4RYJ3_9HYPH|nr:lipopolysaccharide-assembly, LptC-related protein [Methylobacterium iners]GJD95915.1 hypothetical protein OCOJLMKI_3131 [Methylobacterium iners]
MQVVDAIETGLPATRGDARRTRAHARARNHSTRVRALRRLIPVAAGLSLAAVAAAVFLNPFANLPAEVSMGPVSLSGTKVRMESPKLSGFRKGERGYEVTASAALQDVRKPTIVELEAMKGRIDTDDKGGVAHLEAASGLFDTARESLKLDRDIRLWTDKGEEVRLSSAAIDFKAGTVSSRETVTVSVPTGQVTADSLDVVDNGRVISFVGNVRTVFNGSPAAKGAAPAARILTSSAEPPDGRGRP